MNQYQVQIVIVRRTGTDPFQFEEVSRTDPLLEVPYMRSEESWPDVSAFRQAEQYVQKLRRRAAVNRDKVARLIHDATTEHPAKEPFECDYDAADAVIAELGGSYWRFPQIHCKRHDADLDENHECPFCVAEDEKLERIRRGREDDESLQ